jgi:hypothetical protein
MKKNGKLQKSKKHKDMKQIIEKNRIKSIKFEEKHVDKSTNKMLVEKSTAGKDIGNPLEDKEKPIHFYVYSRNNKREITDEVCLFLDRYEAAALRDFIDQILTETI